MKVRIIRVLRHKYGITHPELSRACGLSPQRLSEIELNVENLTPETEQKIILAFRLVAGRRQAEALQLQRDLTRLGPAIFDGVEETLYEL